MNYHRLLITWAFGAMALLPAAADTGADFLSRRQNAADPAVFAVFDTDTITGERLDALKFLYAYMPLPDMAGYPAEFHLANVDATLRARREMPWGKSVPEREWRHFVLPVRVNNESLDLSRPAFYEELRDRVKNLGMKEAILEVNHWCHEKVTYQPSDARTSSPLSTVSQAIGRCGEESTFTVAALRAVGIPARQVYTPRWAHTDDNHAWVEAWADGQWYFLGACEPAPVLDMAWFNAPASRGMLMTTNVFGRYDGPEEKLASDALNTTINVTSKYAPVAPVRVTVCDTGGKPVADATVRFSLYNYAEFFPVAVKTTGASGEASLTAGMGDMVVWATDGQHFGWTKANASGDGPARIVLDKDARYTGSFDMDITPPRPSGSLPSPTAAETAANDRRLQHEDSIRKAYTSTFATEADADALAARLALDRDKCRMVLTQARGNSRRLMQYLDSLPAAMRGRALDLLAAVTEKDRRDIPAAVIDDHITHVRGDEADPLFAAYVLSPRILTEALTPFRSYLLDNAGEGLMDTFAADPAALTDWVRANIRIEDVSNPRRIRMDPRAVWRERHCDATSRDIFFVAMARTAGIPARIDPVTGKTQIVPRGSQSWTDVTFGDTPAAAGSPSAEAGHVDLGYTQVGRLENPKYYFQYSISRIDGGVPRQLEFDEGEGWKEIQAADHPFDPGQYLLVTGQRMADGTVLAHGEIFTVASGSTASVPLVMRHDDTGVQVIGSLNAENIYRSLDDGTDRSILSTTGRGYYVLGLIKPGDEPSAHALNDISAVRGELEKSGLSILLLFADEDAARRFDRTPFTSLPSTVTFGIDKDGTSLGELVASLNLDNASLPIFVIADTFNRVVFLSQGYTIGLGDKIADTIAKISR